MGAQTPLRHGVNLVPLNGQSRSGARSHLPLFLQCLLKLSRHLAPGTNHAGLGHAASTTRASSSCANWFAKRKDCLIG